LPRSLGHPDVAADRQIKALERIASALRTLTDMAHPVRLVDADSP
jgi:hypothetical protein